MSVVKSIIYKSWFEKDMDRSTNADYSTKLIKIQSRQQGMGIQKYFNAERLIII